ncbi:hypothetical protein K438DRAFT_1958976 [Mycena galopus ATCC 62051]|nr:hypothetical protein K438DRAFT_1958976 [Mycena galopus ATCC 62051]
MGEHRRNCNKHTTATLCRRLDTARQEYASQHEVFKLFSLQQAERVPAWKKMVEDYEADGTKKNPYTMKISGMTEAEVRLKFAADEELEAKQGILALHEVTPNSFVHAGLELEQQQRCARVHAELKKAQTTAMVINMKAIRSKFNQGIEKFHKLQATCTPAAIQALAKCVAPADELAENVPLMLTSALSPAEHESGCMAWKAQRCLAGGDASKVRWPELKKEDIRCMEDAEELSRNVEKRQKVTERGKRKEDELREDGLMLGDDDNDETLTHSGESVREVSWIWTMAGTAGMDEGPKDNA